LVNRVYQKQRNVIGIWIKQAEAEVVPSSSLVKVEVEVEVKV